MEPPTPPKSLRKVFLPLYLLLRLMGLVYSLFRTLFFAIPNAHRRSLADGKNQTVPVDCVLVQNPPSIPLLLVAYVFCRTRSLLLQPRPGLVIDWHNLGFTMFDSMTDRHPIRALAKSYERFMAPKADGHLCVTAAMKLWLVNHFGLADHAGCMSVVRDRPPAFFRPTRPMEQHRLMKKFYAEFRIANPALMNRMGIDSEDSSKTLFTEIAGGKARLRKDRPALVISSTSWTPDEDFSILLDACVHIDSKAKEENSSPRFPHVVVIVTGKGPQKQMYEERISRLNLQNVTILTMWLEAADYPLLLGCADLGISLHTSTSGIDLPMKVLDCFGCEVPVCAVNFQCLHELVVDGTNGRVFQTSDELAQQMFALLGSVASKGEVRATGELEHFREGIRGMTRWRENWNESAKDVILGACPSNRPFLNEPPPFWLKIFTFALFYAIFYILTKIYLLPK